MPSQGLFFNHTLTSQIPGAEESAGDFSRFINIEKPRIC